MQIVCVCVGRHQPLNTELSLSMACECFRYPGVQSRSCLSPYFFLVLCINEILSVGDTGALSDLVQF